MKKIRVLLLSLVLSAFLATPVLAQSATPTPRPGLGTGAMRACQAIESAVKGRMTSLTDLATNIEKVFDSIAGRVETFYTDKVVPSGKTVSNYSSLVADISAKKSVVDTDLATAKSLVDAFSCNGSDPKGLLTQFRIDMQKVKSDLQSYRTSIKNLIVAVRSVAPSPNPSESPEPSSSK